MATTTCSQPGPWIDGAEAARILFVPGRRNVQILAERGLIRVRDLPGTRARYSRGDVERLAAESTPPQHTPAR